MKQNKDMFGHFSTPKHSNPNNTKLTDNCYKNPKNAYIHKDNSVLVDFNVTVNDYWIPDAIVKSTSLDFFTKMRKFHNEVCGCDRFKIKYVRSKRIDDTIVSPKLYYYMARSAHNFQFFVRCKDTETFAVQLSLDPKWGETV